MDISDASSERMQLAVERFLRRIDSLQFGRVNIAIWPDDHVEISVASEWLPENITEQTARADFTHAREICEHIAELSPEFQRAILSRPQKYTLVEDYGNGSVALCHLKDDGLVWAPGFRRG